LDSIGPCIVLHSTARLLYIMHLEKETHRMHCLLLTFKLTSTFHSLERADGMKVRFVASFCHTVLLRQYAKQLKVERLNCSAPHGTFSRSRACQPMMKTKPGNTVALKGKGFPRSKNPGLRDNYLKALHREGSQVVPAESA
jgi:hypothetical protein